jgi:hypothetical protein
VEPVSFRSDSIISFSITIVLSSFLSLPLLCPLTANVDVLSRGTELLARVFGASKTLLPSLGNHDTFPADSFSPDSSAPIYAALQRIWAPLLPEAALDTVALGGYYR